MAQEVPDHPGSHTHMPPLTQIPWSLQPPSHFFGVEQFVATSQPSSQTHVAGVRELLQYPLFQQSPPHAVV